MKKTEKAMPQPVDAAVMPKTGSSLDDLFARAASDSRLIEGAKERSLPPVERWEPDFCGNIDMVIKADGRWHYMGSPISRPAMIRLFSTVLRKDADGRTYLVTPVEKIGISVEDAHFIAVEMNILGEGMTQQLTFRTNLGDVIEVSEKNPLRFALDDDNNGLKPYILVRGRLEALVSRAVTYDLVMLAEEVEMEEGTAMVIYSGGTAFTLPC